MLTATGNFMPSDSVFLNRVSGRRSQRLEPCAAKVARTVLRGEKGRNLLLLLD
jgi:hypothetical protein